MPRNIHSVLALNKYVEGEMQHGKADAPKHGLHDPVYARRDTLLIFVFFVFLRRDLSLSLSWLPLFPVSLIEEVALLGKLEQGCFGRAGSIGLFVLDLVLRLSFFSRPYHRVKFSFRL